MNQQFKPVSPLPQGWFAPTGKPFQVIKKHALTKVLQRRSREHAVSEMQQIQRP